MLLPGVLGAIRGDDLACREVLKFHGTMAAFNDRRCPIVFPDALMKRREIASVAFGDEDMGGAPQVRGRFAQGAARQEVLVSERCLAVNQHDVMTPVEFQVLQAVIQDQQIAAERAHGMASALHAVLVHHDGDPTEILCEHERLVAGSLGVKKQSAAFGDDSRRCSGRRLSASLDALVTATEDGDLPPRADRSLASFSTTGVLPVPPTVRLPTLMTGQPMRWERKTLERKNETRSNTMPRYRNESRRRSALSNPARLPARRPRMTSTANCSRLSRRRRISSQDFVTKAPLLSGLQIMTFEPLEALERIADAIFTEDFASGARQQMVEPDPLNHPPIAPAFSPAAMTSWRKERGEP